MKTFVLLGLLSALALAGCQSPTVTHEYKQETTRIISEEPVIGAPVDAP